jgi:hypothetical protein
VTTTTATMQEAIEAAKQGQRTVLRCPAHDDQNPSLSVSPGIEQDVVFHCHANCDPRAIVEAAGLEWGDVCAEREQTQEVWTPFGPASHVYPYYDEHGSLAYEVLRIPVDGGGKKFMQRVPDPTERSGFRWNIEGVERLPYRLPQVIEAVARGGTIHIAEGEKDVHSLLRVIPEGDAATCNSGGAGKWLGSYSHHFAGASVVIYVDADDPGRAHAREVREMLMEHGARVRMVEPPAGRLPSGKPIKDITDHLLAGRGLDDLLETTPESMVDKARTGVDILDLIHRIRQPVEWAIEGTMAKGERLLLVGGEGYGKSTLLRQMGVCVAAGLHPFDLSEIEPKRVLFIDAENHPQQTIDSWTNFVGLCVRHERPLQPGMLTVLEEWDSERDLSGNSGKDWLNERVWAYRPDLVILGPLTNLVERDLKEYEVVNRLRKTINAIRDVCNSAIIMEHHAPLRTGNDSTREWRPYGSGLFLKWPDFGYAMQPTEDKGTYEWRKFRGARVRGRNWPETLREGTTGANSIEFPWMSGGPVS